MNLLIVLSFLISQSVAEDEAPSVYFICKRGDEVRTLRVESESDVCKAYYTKSGVDDQIGTAKQTKVCIDVIDGVKNNLVLAGWNCKSVSSKISK